MTRVRRRTTRDARYPEPTPEQRAEWAYRQDLMRRRLAALGLPDDHPDKRAIFEEMRAIRLGYHR